MSTPPITAAIEMDSSSSVIGTLIGYIVVWAFFAAVTGYAAAKKNRDVLSWAIFGGIIFPVAGLLVLLFLPPLCPRCHQPLSPAEAKRKECPRCRQIEAATKV